MPRTRDGETIQLLSLSEKGMRSVSQEERLDHGIHR